MSTRLRGASLVDEVAAIELQTRTSLSRRTANRFACMHSLDGTGCDGHQADMLMVDCKHRIKTLTIAGQQSTSTDKEVHLVAKAQLDRDSTCRARSRLSI